MFIGFRRVFFPPFVPRRIDDFQLNYSNLLHIFTSYDRVEYIFMYVFIFQRSFVLNRTNRINILTILRYNKFIIKITWGMKVYVEQYYSKVLRW